MSLSWIYHECMYIYTVKRNVFNNTYNIILKRKLNRENSHMLFTVRTLGMDTVYKTICIHTLKSCKLYMCIVPKSVQFALP